MTKFFSNTINFVATCVFFVTVLIFSGTGHASSSTSLNVNSIEPQVEIVEKSHWTKFRDHLTGRRQREKEREYWERVYYDDYYRHHRPPPPPHHHHHPHHHFPHHRR